MLPSLLSTPQSYWSGQFEGFSKYYYWKYIRPGR